MVLKVKSIRAVPPFKLDVVFSDGRVGLFDCARLIEEPGSGQALRDRRYFGTVALENGVPTWPNHFDISPDWLAEEMRAQGTLRLPAPARRR